MPPKKKTTTKKRKLSWQNFVKKFAKDHKITYGEALSKASASYHRQ
jgi:hypothetical protein